MAGLTPLSFDPSMKMKIACPKRLNENHRSDGVNACQLSKIKIINNFTDADGTQPRVVAVIVVLSVNFS